MLYRLELGPVEQGIIEQARRTGAPIPERIKNAPQLLPGLSFYLNAFFDLDSERHYGQGGASRIPWSAIVDYAQYYGCNEDDTEVLGHHIRAMDTAHLQNISDSLKKK